MAENWPQDSSGSQETSQDSGVSSEEQMSNSTGKIATVQSKQNSQAPTTQNNQNNKKYDLGVLFVHGIGNQQAGQTFDAMYDSIKDELISDGSISFSQSSKNKSEAFGTVSLAGKSKKILFRESHWNQDSGDEHNEFSLVLSVLQIICWSLYVLGVRLSKSFILPLLVFGFSAISAVFNQSFEFYKVQQSFYVLIYVLLVLLSLIICVISKKLKTIMWIVGIDAYIALVFFVPWDTFPNGINLRAILVAAPILIFSQYILNLKYWEMVYFMFNWDEILCGAFEDVQKLWSQINESADYVRTGAVFQYIRTVEEHIVEMVNDSDRVIIIGHSMGEYLSYNSLKRNSPSYEYEHIHLIGVGGGLGLVSLIGRLRMSARNNKLSKTWSTVVTFGGAVLGGGMLLITCYLWHSFYLSFFRLLKNLSVINSWFNLFGLSLCVCTLYAFMYFVAQVVGIGPLGLKNFKFYKYSHWLDPVGNSANFFYGNKADMYTTPKFLPGHGISTYFAKNLLKSKDGILTHEKINEIYLRRMIVQHIKSSLFRITPVGKSINHALKIFMYSNLVLCVVIAIYEGFVGVPVGMIAAGVLIYAPIVNIILYPSLIILIWYGEIVSFVRSKPSDPPMLNVLYAVILAFAFGVEGPYIIDILYSLVH